jgi:hypothetical protein
MMIKKKKVTKKKKKKNKKGKGKKTWMNQEDLRSISVREKNSVRLTLKVVYIITNPRIFCLLFEVVGTADCGTVVKVLCYKSEGRWFYSRWCHWSISLT